LTAAGHTVVDFGTENADSTDYPDYARQVAHSVADGAAERGILVCSTGVGMSIAANKVHGVRAALAFNPDEVKLTREHNNVNVLALGARYVDAATAGELVRIFLETPFSGGERHARRLAKVVEMEKE